uniref:Secreted protein n=1 Tax=Cacopsylla melanoneura TaxID=428564 RepID=A0A8D8QV93_9HEMI
MKGLRTLIWIVLFKILRLDSRPTLAPKKFEIGCAREFNCENAWRTRCEKVADPWCRSNRSCRYILSLFLTCNRQFTYFIFTLFHVILHIRLENISADLS